MGLVGTDANQAVVLKMATLAPQNSVWYNALMQMGSTWKKTTNGQVSMTLFAGQTQGSDEDVLRKMRINQLQGAALSAIGLWQIDEATNVIGIPLFYQSDAELFHVLAALTPMLSKRFEERGFVLLSWGHAGWAQVFSRQPIKTLDDLKRAKLFTSAGDEKMVRWYRERGFNPVPRATTDLMTSLQTGQIDALPVPPLAALFMRYDTLTPYMLDVARPRRPGRAGGGGGSARPPAVVARLDRAVRAYRNPRVLAMLFLGFSAGLPFMLVFSTLSAWLREAGIERATSGMLSWVGIIYSVKMFWAPVVDRLQLPVLGRLLGRRRIWMRVAQAGIAIGLANMAHMDPLGNLGTVAALALLVAFSSATQDISVDAWRTEAAPPLMQGTLAAAYQLGYRLALMVASAGALWIAADRGWTAAYTTMAAENNRIALALKTHRQLLGDQLPLHVASRYSATDVLEV